MITVPHRGSQNTSNFIRRVAAAALVILFLVATGFRSQAASGQWNGATSASWLTSTNWTTADPGATSGAASTDVATFGTLTGTNGTVYNPIIIDSGRNVLSITYSSLWTTPGYVIGNTSGNILTLSSGGAVTMGAGETNAQIIDAPLVIGASGAATTYTFANSTCTLSSGMTLAGTITGGGGTGTLALAFNGGSGGGGGTLNVVSGAISDGGGSDPTSVSVSGVGNHGGGSFWEFSGINSYSGGTAVSGGVLAIGNNNALGSGTLAISGGAIEAYGGNYTISNNLLWSVASSNYSGFIGSGNLTVNGTTSFLNATQKYFNNATGTLTFAGGVNLSSTGQAVTSDNLAGPGTTVIAPNTVISDNGAAGTALIYSGPGTLDIQGHAASTGAWQFNGGTVILDYSTDTASKIGSGALTLGGVNLQLKGGSGTQAVTSTAFGGGGQINISQNGSSETIALGAISNATAWTTTTPVNFQSGAATTTTLTTNSTNSLAGLLGSTTFYTVGSQGAADWAAVTTSSSIVAYSSINSYANLVASTAGTVATNMALDGSLTLSGSASIPTLKITASDNNADTLTLTNNLILQVSGGILDTVASNQNYTITGSSIILGTGVTNIQQYGNGPLTINSNIVGNSTNVFQKAGPGTLVLGGANIFGGALAVNQGTLSVASDSNLGGVTGTVTVASASTGSKTVTLASAAPSTLYVGAAFLGSTISAVAGTSVTLVANANATISSNTSEPYAVASSIEINSATLEATSSFSLGETNGAAVQNRTVNLGTNGGTLQVDSGVTLTVAGIVSSGPLTKTGAGTLILSGANTYGGGTNISGGILQAGAANVLGFGSIPLGSSALQSPLVISNNATLDMEGTAQTTGPVTLVSGTIQDSVGGALLHGFSYNLQSGVVNTVLGDVGLGFGGGGADSAAIKTTSGKVILSSSNTFSGGIEINGGVVEVNCPEYPTSIVSASYGSGPLGGGNYSDAKRGGISFGGGTLQYSATNQYDYSLFIVNSGSAISIDTNGQGVTYASALWSTNTGGLTLNDTAATTGTLTLTAANQYSGLTQVTSGELDLNTTTGQPVPGNLTVSGSGVAKLLKASQISSAGNLVVSGGTFNSQGFNQTLAGVQLSGGASILGTTGTLTSTSTYDMQAGSVSARLGGTVGLTKTTAGSVTLSGSDSYSGATAVNGGVLIVSGSLSGTVSVSVAANSELAVIGKIGATASPAISGTLAGTGIIAGSVGLTGGVIAPGTPGSALTISGTGINLDSASLFAFTLASTGTASDSVLASGTINLTSGAGLTLSDPGRQALNYSAGTIITLFSGAPHFIGTFANFNSLPQLAAGLAWSEPSFYSGAQEGQLDVIAVPEPQTWAALLGAFGILAGLQRMRRRTFRE